MSISEKSPDPKAKVLLDKVIPTLFIGVGGTGAEVLWRIRRRILNRVWNQGGQACRLQTLNEFPFAEFLHIDLDMNTVVETGKSTSDPLQAQIAFKPKESYVKKLDLEQYTSSDESLKGFPLIEDWFPLSANKIREIGINPEKGAGQIRSISRLYFYDRYQDIKTAIERALSDLRNSIDNSAKHQRLGLELMTNNLRVVVVGSTAGGTGSGAFIDVGYLTKALMKRALPSGAGTNQLMLMLPTGYVGKNADRVQANTYAALMELETSMRGSTHVSKWAENDYVEFPRSSAPYSDVYFFDTENAASEKTGAATDCFDLAADVLFEDFSTAEFANKKRSIAVNQAQHKVMPHATRVDQEKYGDLKLTFSRSYSAFGQAVLDTQLEQKQGNAVEHQVGQMLGLFFGVSADSDLAETPQPTEGERDDLLGRLHLKIDNEVVGYDFATPHDKFKKGAECSSAPIVKELLRVNGSVRIDSIETNIANQFGNVQNTSSFKEWPAKLQELLNQIQRDTIKKVETGTGIHEDGIETRREDLLRSLLNVNSSDGVIKALWTRVDNKEKGGLDFTIELITRMKDRMENQETGWVKTLGDAEKTFAEMSDFILNTEIATLKEHLDQAVGKWVGGESVAKAKWNQLCQASQAFVRYRLLSVACREAAKLVKDLSKGLGFKSGTDSRGEPIWGGFIGELERGRQNVVDLMQSSAQRIFLAKEAMKQEHAMYAVLPAPAGAVESLMKLPKEKSQEWAKEVFENLGGTQELFSMLDDEREREDLVAKLRNQALSKLAVWSKENGESTNVNPLFSALENLPSNDRKRILSQTMRRAMPWVAVKLDEYLKKQSPEDQFQCVVGVKNSKEFKAKFAQDMLDAIPSNAKMTAGQVDFVEISEPGKLVCYIELTGFPAPALTGIDKWYSSYQIENNKIPTHTHKSLGKFVHVRELQPNELAERKKDLELLIQALALGELRRVSRTDNALVLNMNGVNRRVGEEKSIRLNGFNTNYRDELVERVDAGLASLKSPEQLALWWALMEYHKDQVYPIRVVTGDDNVDTEEKHLPTLVCENLVKKAQSRLSATGLDDTTLRDLKKTAKYALQKWTEEIAGSENDPYFHEINQGSLDEEANDKPRTKRVLKEAVFFPQWRLAEPVTYLPQNHNQIGLVPNQAGGNLAEPPPLPPQIGAVPPVTIPSQQLWHISVAGGRYGPFTKEQLYPMITTKQFTAQSMVWSEGMLSWMAASTVPDFAPWFTAVPPPMGGGMPPTQTMPPPLPE